MKLAPLQMLSRNSFSTLICTLVLALGLVVPGFASAQTPNPRLLPTKDSFLLTVVLKHVQTKNIRQIREERDENGFANFPPEGVELVGDYRMLGLGRVMILKVPAEMLRILTVAIEENVWGPYETDLYLTYDLIAARAAAAAATRAR